MVNRNTGFTLVELIIVIMLVSILAATAGPSIFGRSGTEESVLNTSLINLLRTQQVLAMQDTIQPCYGIEHSRTAIVALRCDRGHAEGSRIDLPEGVTLTVFSEIAGDGRFYFNGNGCPVASSHEHTEQSCQQSEAVEFQFGGQQTQYICIASQGYISLGRCS